jgi:predicted metalloprotease with PDZ domain
MQVAMIDYTLSFAQYYQHLIKVKVRFNAQAQQKIWLPTWIPGSYLIREFARHIEAVKAQQLSTGQAIKLQKLSKNQWQLQNTQPDDIEISYQVYAFDLSVRGAYIDDERLYVNPAAVCIGIAGQEDSTLQVQLQVPDNLSHFKLATSMPVINASKTAYTLTANSYHELIDQPLELAEQACAGFEAGNIRHRIAISGRHQTDLHRLSTDLEKICSAQIQLFGEAPFNDYLFMVMATANSYGGLEHQSSTSLITPRDDLPKSSDPAKPSANYQRFLGLCSHEYFHAWLVKFIRPHNYVKPNLHQEDYTTLLWVFEGITSYYDDLMLYRSGIIDQDAYLDLVRDQMNRYFSNPGRHIQSVAESSFDAWIKYYRPDENSNNAGTSYYNKGALVALCLDLSLRQSGSSLDALVQALYQRAKKGQQVDEQTLPQLCQQLTGTSFSEFFDHYVEGTVELPLQALLAEFGVSLMLEDKVWALGIKAQETPQGLLVQQVLRDSAAAQAGLSAQDTLIALNGLKATHNMLQQLGTVCDDVATAVTCHAFRRDELKVFKIHNQGMVTSTAKLQVLDINRLNQWMN